MSWRAYSSGVGMNAELGEGYHCSPNAPGCEVEKELGFAVHIVATNGCESLKISCSCSAVLILQ